VTEHLVRMGAQVRAFVYYNSFNSWGWLDESPDDIKRALDVLRRRHPRTHTASAPAVKGLRRRHAPGSADRDSLFVPLADTYVDTNVKGTLNIVQGRARTGGRARRAHVDQRGLRTARSVPIDESHRAQGQSPYSASKIGRRPDRAQLLPRVRDAGRHARPFNTYGPRQSARAVIRRSSRRSLPGRGKSGSARWRRPAISTTSATRSAGMVALASCEQAVVKVVNLGSNFEISIGDTARLIARLIEREVEFVSDEERLRPEAERGRALVGGQLARANAHRMEPAYAGLGGSSAGLRETIDWFRDPANLRRYKAGLYNI
jgi:dTDP-glucose 4,6-dehydratase